VVARVKWELDEIKKALTDADISTLQFEADGSDQGKPEAVRLATMHRVKGLEFDKILLASVNQGLIPLQQAIRDRGDAVELRQADLEE
jgi:superfamily I DNA/RNA helicase